MPLTDNLVSHWKLDELSGNAIDSFGTNTLTETSGTIAAATGKIGGARDFEATVDTEYFEIADNASLSITGSMTITAWVNPESFGNNPNMVVSKYLGAQKSYSLWLVQTTGQAAFVVSSDGAAATTATASTFGNLSAGTWYFLCGRFDDAANLIKISVNLTENTAAFAANIFDGTATFVIGAQAGFSYYDGLIDEVSIWNRALSDVEVTQLYNSGSGLAFPWGGDNISSLHPIAWPALFAH